MWHPDMPLEYRDTIVTGDARVLSERIPDESVDLIFTDPVYDRIDDYRWLAEIAGRVLRPSKSLLAMAGNMEKPAIYDVMRGYPPLVYHWEAAILYRGANFFMNSKYLQVSWKPLLWFTSGHREAAWCKDALEDTRYEKELHHWQQSQTSAIWFYRQLTRPDDIIFDPFCGSGTFPATCKMLGRNYVAFEIEPDVAERARQRVLMTQPPLFVLQPEQLTMNDVTET